MNIVVVIVVYQWFTSSSLIQVPLYSKVYTPAASYGTYPIITSPRPGLWMVHPHINIKQFVVQVEVYEPPQCSPLLNAVNRLRDKGWKVLIGGWYVGLYRISGLFYIRYPAGYPLSSDIRLAGLPDIYYPVLFAGYPAGRINGYLVKLLEQMVLRMNILFFRTFTKRKK